MIDLNLSMVGLAHLADDSRLDLFYFNCGCSLEVNRAPRVFSATFIVGFGPVVTKATHDRVAKFCSREHAIELAALVMGQDDHQGVWMSTDPAFDKLTFVA